jgi:hypothetical protein
MVLEQIFALRPWIEEHAIAQLAITSLKASLRLALYGDFKTTGPRLISPCSSHNASFHYSVHMITFCFGP